MKNSLFYIFAVMLLFALPVAGGAYQERLLLSLGDEKCSLRVEADDEAQILRLRVHPGPPRCYATKEKMQTILKSVFSRTVPSKPAEPYTSLFLGRLNDYPWLCEYVATAAYQDPRWDRRRGKPVSMDLYKYVRTILSNREVTGQFEEALEDSGYKIVSVTLEKVCVGRFSDVPLYKGKMLPGKVPVDAVVWFRLGRK